MVGRASNSRPLQYAGLAVAAVAAVGTTTLGWSFGGSDPVPIAIGAVAALVGLGVGVYRQRAGG